MIFPSKIMELQKVELQEIQDLNIMKETIARLNTRLQAMENFVAGKFGDVVINEFNQNYERSLLNIIPAEYVTVQLNNIGSTGQILTPANFIHAGQTLKTTDGSNKSFEIQIQDSEIIFPLTTIPQGSLQNTMSLNDITTVTIPDTMKIMPSTSGTSSSSLIKKDLKLIKFHQCPICLKKFKRRDTLREHQKLHSNTINLEVTSPGDSILSRISSTKLPTTTSQTTTTTVAQIITSQGGTSTTHIIPVQFDSSGQAHIITSNPIDPERKHVCHHCGKTYKRRGHVNQHIKLAHTDDKKFKCVRCDKAFGQNSMLVQHLKRCSETIKKFICEYCEKRFLTNPELTKHRRIHTGEKPFGCPICGKAFAIKSNVDTHMRVHTGVKPVACPICNKGFSRKEVVEKHMKIHTSERNFQCKDCGELFLRKYHLTCHWNDVHKIKYNFTEEELTSIKLPGERGRILEELTVANAFDLNTLKDVEVEVEEDENLENEEGEEEETTHHFMEEECEEINEIIIG